MEIEPARLLLLTFNKIKPAINGIINSESVNIGCFSIDFYLITDLRDSNNSGTKLYPNKRMIPMVINNK